MITQQQQIRMALALLDWSQQGLAKRAGIAFSTVNGFLTGTRKPTPANLRAMLCCIREQGVDMSDRGVFLRAEETPEASPPNNICGNH